MPRPQATSDRGGVQQLAPTEGAPTARSSLETLGSLAEAVPNVGVLKLAAITFFAVAGGPFGIEPLVQAGGARWAVIGLFAAPWVWGMPSALMTAELSTAIPESGGYIVWVRPANFHTPAD